MLFLKKGQIINIYATNNCPSLHSAKIKSSANREPMISVSLVIVC